MLTVRYGEPIDRTVEVGELVTDGAQHLLDLHHHYYSPHWNASSPDEGEVFEGSTDWKVKEQLAAMGLFGELLNGYRMTNNGAVWGRVMVYGMRAYPGVDGELSAEAGAGTIKQVPKTVDGLQVAEIGIGFVTAARPRSYQYTSGVRVCLRGVGAVDPDITVTRSTLSGIDRDRFAVNSVETYLRPAEDMCKDFAELHRKLVWESVSEPA
jgi:hypothetical protein